VLGSTLKNSLLKTLAGLKGNPRACVYTEPLWGLSMNLCLPYASVYMLAIGLNDSQVGLVATVYMLSQVVFAFFSGPITDKLGRRKSTAVFDFIAWCLPCLIWWRAENFWFFFVAALINGTMKVTQNSWDCLLVEDADKDKITGIYSLVMVCANLSALLAPISSIIVSRLTLVPAIRILYINAFVLMTVKLVVLYVFSRETGRGIIRLEETRGKSIFSIAAGYGGVLKLVLKSRATIFSLVIAVLVGIVGMINTTFWQVIVNKKLLVPEILLPVFSALRSVVAIAFLFLAAPHLTKGILKSPLLTGFAFYFIGQIILILAPVEGALKYIMLCISLAFDGFGSGSLMMLSASLMALSVNPEERARVMAILHMLIMAATSPFGWIGGMLSSISRNLPFVLNLFILVIGFGITLIYYRKDSGEAGRAEPATLE
jgi:MFS family permease